MKENPHGPYAKIMEQNKYLLEQLSKQHLSEPIKMILCSNCAKELNINLPSEKRNK